MGASQNKSKLQVSIVDIDQIMNKVPKWHFGVCVREINDAFLNSSKNLMLDFFSDTMSVHSCKLCMMIMIIIFIEFYTFIPISVTLI